MDLVIGAHCSQPDCKQLDFLPYTCTACKNVYCQDHWTPEHHHCPISMKLQAVECPVCHQNIVVKKGQNSDTVMVDHLDAGCPKQPKLKSAERYPCHYAGCKVDELVPVVCTFCRLTHCVSHRNPERHNCKKIPSPSSSPSNNTGIVSPSSNDSSKSSKLSEAWAALQSRLNSLRSSGSTSKSTGFGVKTKLSSIGNNKLAEQERIYLKVLFPVDSGVEPAWMFFDSKWPAGRALDVIADYGKIDNKNHLSSSRKLSLVDIESGESIKLQTNLKSIWKNGDAILLEFSDVLAHNSSGNNILSLPISSSSSSSPSPSSATSSPTSIPVR